MPAAGNAAPGLMSVDTVVLWTGGSCEVDMQHNGRRQQWLRTSGSIDLLPAGTVIESVQWNGDAMNCVWANIDALSPPGSANVEATLGLSDSHVTDLMQRLEHEAHDSSPNGPEYASALAQTLATYLRARARRSMRDAPSSRPGSLTRIQCEALRAFVDDHIGRPLSVAELALICGHSTTHFSRLFRESFGTSPHQFLMERRIERAKQLLLDRRRPIAEVAVECGFATQAHLHDVFKRRLGMTPGQFRG